MNFISINEYFNKMQSFLLVLMLIPVLAFSALYMQPNAEPVLKGQEFLIVFVFIITTDWLIMFILFNKKIKSIRNDQGLRLKLEKYFGLTTVRYSVIAAGGIISALGYYLMHHDIFTLLFAAQILIAGLLWPTPSKVCNDIKLRGDEREMVYYKKDHF